MDDDEYFVAFGGDYLYVVSVDYASDFYAF